MKRKARGGWYPDQKRMSVNDRREWLMRRIEDIGPVDCQKYSFVDMYFDKTGAPAEACLGVDLRQLVKDGRLAKRARPTCNARHPFHVTSYYIPAPEVQDVPV